MAVSDNRVQTNAIDIVLVLALLTVSRRGQLLRSWDVSSGQLKYEVSTSLPAPSPQARPLPLHQAWRPGGALAVLAGKKGGSCIHPKKPKSLYQFFSLVNRCSGNSQWVKGDCICVTKWRQEVVLLYQDRQVTAHCV